MKFSCRIPANKKISLPSLTNMDIAIGNKILEVITEEEKQYIVSKGKEQYKDSIQSRRVQVVLIQGVVSSAKAPFMSGWVSGAIGHWGIVVDGLFHHLVFQVDEHRKPFEIKFKREDFEDDWVNEENGAREDIGLTSLPLEAIKAIGESLLLHFGDYRRLYRNCQTFAEIFTQLVCDVQSKPFGVISTHLEIKYTLIAYPLRTHAGTIIHVQQKQFMKTAMKKSKNNSSWEDLVDAEITQEIKTMGLEIDRSKASGCCLM
jgi:hypothetical protein